jgi:predicted DNA-binding transcriptional regulator AlpA
MNASKFLPARAVAARYGIAERTVDRWIETGALPPPLYIQKRRYWDADALDAFEAARQEAMKAA